MSNTFDFATQERLLKLKAELEQQSNITLYTDNLEVVAAYERMTSKTNVKILKSKV